jgi:hypothetical protein
MTMRFKWFNFAHSQTVLFAFCLNFIRSLQTNTGLNLKPFARELLFDVVSRAYKRTILIVTTNLPFEQWPKCWARTADGRAAGPAEA